MTKNLLTIALLATGVAAAPLTAQAETVVVDHHHPVVMAHPHRHVVVVHHTHHVVVVHHHVDVEKK